MDKSIKGHQRVIGKSYTCDCSPTRSASARLVRDDWFDFWPKLPFGLKS